MTIIDLICSVIAMQEGWFDQDPNVIPRLRNNPGDIRFAGQIGASAPGWNKIGYAPVATFTTSKAGTAALYRQVWMFVAMGFTLRQIVSDWDRGTEKQYLADVQQWTQLPADTPIIDLLPPLAPVPQLPKITVPPVKT